MFFFNINSLIYKDIIFIKIKMADNKPVPIEQSQVPQPFNTSEKNNQYQGVINVPSSFNISGNSNNIGEINRENYFEIKICKLRLQYLAIIFILLVIIYDITLQIVFDFVNIFAMMDNIIVIVLISRLLVICLNRINFHSKKLSFEIALIILFGFCVKGFSISYCLMKEDANLLVLYCLAVGLRTFGLIWLLPLTCRK